MTIGLCTTLSLAVCAVRDPRGGKILTGFLASWQSLGERTEGPPGQLQLLLGLVALPESMPSQRQGGRG